RLLLRSLSFTYSLCPYFSLFSTLRLPPRSTLFPYTTLFRSVAYIFVLFAGLSTLFYTPRTIEGSVGTTITFTWAVLGIIGGGAGDRKSTRLNSSHVKISYAVFCLKKKNIRIAHHNSNTSYV